MTDRIEIAKNVANREGLRLTQVDHDTQPLFTMTYTCMPISVGSVVDNVTIDEVENVLAKITKEFA